MFNMTPTEYTANSGLVPLASGSALTALSDAKYNMVMSPAVASDGSGGFTGLAGMADAAVITYTWYLPSEPATGPSNTAQTTATGDRWNNGGSLKFFASITAEAAASASANASNDCVAAGLTLALGASTLAAAGAATLAAALSF